MIPFLDYFGPAWFRRRVLDILPIKSLQRIKNVCDTLYEKAQDILAEKKAAIARGDQEFLDTIGEGRDMMSLLRMDMLCYTESTLTPVQSEKT